MLTEDKRKQLDDIVGKMAQNGETDDSINFVVNDFKSKYAVEEPDKSFLEKTAGVLDAVFGGGKIGEAIGTKIASMSKSGRELARQEEQGIAPKGTTAQTFTKPTKGQLAGSALQSAALFIPGGAGARAITTGAKAVGLKTGVSAIGKIGAGASAGYVFDIANNLQQGKTGAQALPPGFGAVIGGAIPAAGVAKNVIVRFGNNQSPRIINSLIKPLQKDFAYGKNPGRAVAEEGIVANNFDELITKIRDSRQAIGQSIGTLSESLSTAPIISIRNSLSPLDDAIKVAASQNNQTLISRLNNVKRTLTEVLEPAFDDAGNITIKSVGSRDLENLTFKQVRNILGDVGELTQFTGNPSDDKLVNMALKQIYGKIKGESLDAAQKINPQVAQEFKKLTEKYGDLMSAEVATKYRDKIVERQNLIGLSPQTAGIASGLLTAVATGGAAIPTIVVGLSGAVLEKLASTPGFKTRLAYLLSNKTQREATYLFRKIPALSKFFTLKAGATPGDVILSEVKKTLDETKNLPNKQGGFVRIGKQSEKGLPKSKVNESVSSLNDSTLLKEAKKYKTAEEFVKATSGNQGVYKDKTIEKIILENRLKAEPFDFEWMQRLGSTPEIKGDMVKVYRATTNGKILPGDNVSIYDVKQYIGPDKTGLDITAAKMGLTKLSGRSDIQFVEKWIPKKDLYQTPAGTQLYAPNGVKSLEDFWKNTNQMSALHNNKQAGFVNLGLDEIVKRKPISGERALTGVLAGTVALGMFNKLLSDQMTKTEEKAYREGLSQAQEIPVKEIKLQQFVPEEYKPVVIEATKGLKVRPEEIAALIQTENAMWDEEFVNPQGTDTGLGQHNANTYEDINKLYKEKYGKSYNRKNGKENIKATALWLDHLLTREGINGIDDAVKAYRIGVQGLLAVRQGKGTARFTEQELRDMANDKLESYKQALQG